MVIQSETKQKRDSRELCCDAWAIKLEFWGEEKTYAFNMWEREINETRRIGTRGKIKKKKTRQSVKVDTKLETLVCVIKALVERALAPSQLIP